MAEQRYGGRNICEFTSWSTSKRQRGYTGDGASLLKPQSYPSGTLPAVPYFPVFPKELHQLGPSIQTCRVCGGRSYPNHHKLFIKWFYPLSLLHYKKTMEGRELIFNFWIGYNCNIISGNSYLKKTASYLLIPLQVLLDGKYLLIRDKLGRKLNSK